VRRTGALAHNVQLVKTLTSLFIKRLRAYVTHGSPDCRIVLGYEIFVRKIDSWTAFSIHHVTDIVSQGTMYVILLYTFVNSHA